MVAVRQWQSDMPHGEVLPALGCTEQRVVYPKLVCHH